MSIAMTLFFKRYLIAIATISALSGCSYLPTIGPSSSEIDKTSTQIGTGSLQIVNVDDAVARKLLAFRTQRSFSDVLGGGLGASQNIGSGDIIEISIWEAPPATLFGVGAVDARSGPSASRVTTFPEQVVSREGSINIPFAGAIKVSGSTLSQIEKEIVNRLKGKANQPQVIARLIRNTSSTVTVVGEVTTSTRFPLTPLGERLLDAIAAAGGAKQPINKTTIQMTRGSQVYSLPLETVIRDPKQNVVLQPGDVVTALFQSLSFTALGATGKNEEINFEAQGISLAQALARSGGLLDARSNPQGVFIFRYEPADALTWPTSPVATTPEGTVPVIYKFDLKNPTSFFVMQSFAMSNKDLLYVSNAPIAEFQKFLNVVFSVAYPVLNAAQVVK
jgi:polysaccharide biosynthesis/export protein